MPEPSRRRQTKQGLDAIFSPHAVVVVGASARPGSVGGAILASLIAGGFKGPLFAVHPTAREVMGKPAFATVEGVPGALDLAVVAVPAAQVAGVARACARKGVRGLVVVSAGFREADSEGEAREAELAAIVRENGIRMVGPNCLGVINNAPEVRLQAVFGSRPVAAGTTALVTQSGAVGIALMEHAAHVGLGLARFASMGNKTDVSGNDLMLLWEEDPGVRQILFYLENFGNPRNFVDIARRITQTKPIVVLKSGRTAPGAHAASSHTGALSQSDSLVDALLEQCGVVRASSVEEMFDCALALETQAPLAGPRIAMVTNSGGPAILALDALSAAGLAPAAFAPATKAALARWIPAASHAENPVDLLASGSPEAFEGALGTVLEDPGVDGALAIWTPLEASDFGQAEAIGRAFARSRKPGVAVVFGHGPGAPGFEALKSARTPVFTFPENAVRSLGVLRQIHAWRERAGEGPPKARPGREAARRVLAKSRVRADGWLEMGHAFALAEAYGLPVPRYAWVHSAAEASAQARDLGEVAVKMEAPGLVHKSDAGAVRLAVTDAGAAFESMQGRLAAQGYQATGALVMQMAPPGPELLVGATQDPLFGPLVACGAGGVYTEILRDVQFRLAPLMAGDAKRMVAALRMAPILAGARGSAPADVEALHAILEKVAQLAVDLPEVQEFEVNPVRVYGAGALALDVRARVRPAVDATLP
ncbi:MAG: acetate--CoA ligase family protein [Thermoplasmatota archaeon]